LSIDQKENLGDAINLEELDDTCSA